MVERMNGSSSATLRERIIAATAAMSSHDLERLVAETEAAAEAAEQNAASERETGGHRTKRGPDHIDVGLNRVAVCVGAAPISINQGRAAQKATD